MIRSLELQHSSSEHDDPATIRKLKTMHLRYAPLPFFTGLAIGLIGVSWLGATVSSPYLVQSFVRFHQRINVEGGYFPTARQIRSILEARAEQPPRVFVIVAGSSVFHGVGQQASLIWTRFLQEHLGPQFRVINFAQRAGSTADFGNIAAELLLQRSQPVIFVGDASPNSLAAPLET